MLNAALFKHVVGFFVFFAPLHFSTWYSNVWESGMIHTHTHHLSDKCDFLFLPTQETFTGAHSVCDYSTYFAYKPTAPTNVYVFVCLAARYINNYHF